MTSLHLRRPRPREIQDFALLAAFAAWLVAVFALQSGRFLPGERFWTAVILFVTPLLAMIAALLRRSTRGSLPLVAGSACAVALALVLPLLISVDPKIAYAFPLAVIGGLLANRYPTATLLGVFFLTGTYGSIIAFTGIHGESVADKLIDAAWAGLIGRMLLGRQPLRVRATPLLFVLLGYLVITIGAAVTTVPIGDGIRALRLAPLYLSLVLLIGYGAFRQVTLDRVARGMVLVCALVAAYATFRWAVGPAAKESALQSSEFERQYNRLAGTGDIKLQGSLLNGNSLGLWMACTIPFVVAMAISTRGLIRLVAVGTLPLSAIALLGSSQRAGAAAAIAGVFTIVVVHMLSRGFRGPRLGVAAATAVLMVGGAAVVYPAVVDNPEKQKRYSALLNPGEDAPFQERLHKWRNTLDAVAEQPFGHGLGAGNPIAVGHRFADIGYYEIDNSYLMIAYDQGLLVAIFFVVVVLIMLFELLGFAIWTRAPAQAALATGAVGTLIAMLVEFMAANYIASPVIVAGWMIVGLGVAQFGSLRDPAASSDRPPRRLQRVRRVPDREALAHAASAGRS